jgi:hypothetical protein
MHMKTILAAMSLALATVMPLGADASELKPLEAGTFMLGAQSVSIYYVPSGDTYEVVATIAPDAGAPGTPIRFVGFLQPGQKALVSAGEFGTATAPETLELVHEGSLLSATHVTNVATAN